MNDNVVLQELPEDPELLEQDDEEQLDDINRLLAETKQPADGQDAAEEAGLAKVQQRPQVIDDFFRNFLLKSMYEMKRSLEVFQAEWYEMQQTGKFKDSELTIVPDVYTRNHGFQQADSYRVIGPTFMHDLGSSFSLRCHLEMRVADNVGGCWASDGVEG
ncbi:Flagellar WD repeat-containing protein Pf20 [Symbiodinium microadriaticum]|uniref:Flagellar WD repeat-containing protein Pf20 n=1 Tax=Symbiodinium microadriaticum TaxID=2951 RepID=A0A1Q9CCD5_SYMMI|nr:Flagellar WD repeat-containing protein Pf20 [Symbiodinium microadriaticum]